MSKVSNTLNMLRLLETGKKYSVSELANKLEVTPRMVKIYRKMWYIYRYNKRKIWGIYLLS